MDRVVNDIQEERPLRIEAAADYLGVTVRWMRRAVENELFAYHRAGRYLLFLPSDLRAYMRSIRVEPGGKDRTIDLRILGPKPTMSGGPSRTGSVRRRGAPRREPHPSLPGKAAPGPSRSEGNRPTDRPEPPPETGSGTPSVQGHLWP